MMLDIITEKYYSHASDSVEPFWVHTFSTGKETYFTNAFVIETGSELVVMDALMTVSDASEILRFADERDKPIVAVVITHPHPDHYAGAGVLVTNNPEVEIISTLNVKKEIQRIDPLLSPVFHDKYGDDWPQERPLPNKIVADGDMVRLANLDFTLKEFGCGESDWDTVWYLNASTPLIFVGDMVFGEVHSYMADGYTNVWLDSLDTLKESISSETRAFTGHGICGNAYAMITSQKQYLQLYRETVQELLEQYGGLTPEAQSRLVRKMKGLVKNDILQEFITAGCDAVAKEVANELSKTKELEV